MHGINLLLTGTFFAFIVSIFIVFIIGYLSYRLKIISKIKGHSTDISAIFYVCSLVTGTAAALGGAIATINTADLGLQLAQATDRLQSTRFVEERLTKSTDLYGSVLEALSQLYASEVYFEAGISSHHEGPLNDLDKDDLNVRKNNIRNYLNELSKALRATSRDEFSAFCFRKWWKGQENRVERINDQIRVLDASINSHMLIDPKDLTDLSYIIDKASNDTNASIDNFINISESKKSDITGNIRGSQIEGNLEMDAYIKLGNILSKQYRFVHGSSVLYGLAIMRDIAINIPTGLNIVSCFQERYKNISLSKEEMEERATFSPSAVIGVKLDEIIRKFDESQDHYITLN